MGIEEYRFGRITVDGVSYADDIKIVRGMVKPGWWRKSGHSVEIADIEDVLEAAPEIFVLGTGASGRVRVSEDFRTKLARRGIKLMAEPTDQAVKTYERLMCHGKNVAAGFHLTC